MSKSTDIKPKHVSCETEEIQYRAPMKFGGRVVSDVTLLHVTAEVETGDGKVGKGFGSMPMGNVWAWPSSTVSNSGTLMSMVAFAKECVNRADMYMLSGHALDITTHLAEDHAEIAADMKSLYQLEEAMPKLAQLVAASPLEAAIHDAYGKAHGASSYDVLGKDFVSRDLRMCSVAERCIGSLLTLAKIGFTILFGGKRFGREFRAGMRTIAEWLVAGFAAGAEVVFFARFGFDRFGFVISYSRFAHGIVD